MIPIIVGTNHKYSPIKIRERIYFSKQKLKDALSNLVNSGTLKGGVIVSTCNRVELYSNAPDAQWGMRQLKAFLAGYHLQTPDFLKPYLYAYAGKEAILHLFSVASGLDSQIVGERQILDQIRFAYQEAVAVGTTDNILDLLFDKAMQTALRVREETEISKGNISIASIVTDLIKSRYGLIKDKKILIFGVNKISELLISILKKEGVKAVFVSNRTYEKACQLARYINAEAVRLDRFKEQLKDTDIIISATSSPHFVIKEEDLEGIKKPLLVIDLAVPRDVDPRIRQIEGISLFCLDDLDFIINKNLNRREEEISSALKIIEQEVDQLCSRKFLEWEPEPAHWL